MSPSHPIVARRADDVLFRRGAAPVTSASFLHAARIVARDLPAGGFVLNLCGDRLHFAVAFAAAILAGKVSLLSGERTTESIATLAQSHHGLVALTDAAFDGTSGAPDLPIPRRAISIEAHLSALDASAGWAPASIASDQLVALVFTSGSTGQPVPHPKTWGALTERSIAAGQRFDLAANAPATLVGTVPSHHMYGFETTILLPWHAPVSSSDAASFFPDDVRVALQAAPEPRMLITTPVHIRALLQAKTRLPGLAAAISATAPLERALAAEAESAWNAPVYEIFGATEVGSIASRRTTADDAWTLYPGVRFSGSSGPDGSDLSVEAPFAKPHGLADVVELVDATRFRLIGRKNDLVKVAGRRASLGGLNRILSSLDGVLDATFVAPDDLDRRPASRMLAFVVAPDRSPQDLLSELRGRIDPAFLPRRIIALERLPRDNVGKLSRKALLALRKEADESAGSFVIPADHPGLPGHFPGQPVVPGVVLLDEAFALIGARLGAVRVTGVDGVKFLAPVAPGRPVDVTYNAVNPGRVAFACAVGGTVVARGTVSVRSPSAGAEPRSMPAT